MKEKILRVPYQYKNNPDISQIPLEYQLEALKEIGFSNVDCY